LGINQKWFGVAIFVSDPGNSRGVYRYLHGLLGIEAMVAARAVPAANSAAIIKMVRADNVVDTGAAVRAAGADDALLHSLNLQLMIC
jgi:hypothetical protein